MDPQKLFHFETRKGLPSITGRYGLSSYAFEYWEAARGMMENKMYSGVGRPDFSTFPIAFLYRHALELLLKSILVEHHEIYSEDPELLLNAKDRGHRLTTDYLKDLRAVVDKARTLGAVIEITASEWSEIETVLREWNQHDPDGMAFRYSIDKKAKKVLLGSDFTFDIEKFSESMENVLGVLAHLRAQLFHFWYQGFLRSEGLVEESPGDDHD